MEPIDAIRGFLHDDAYEPIAVGHLHPLLPARREGPRRQRSAASATARCSYNPAYAPDLVRRLPVAHLHAARGARHGALLLAAHRAGRARDAVPAPTCTRAARIALPAPDAPGRNFGMRLDLAAEMEYFSPEDRLSLQRILFYGRGGFDVDQPAALPLPAARLPRPEEIRATGNTPVPFMMLLRRMGRERQATLPIDEARAMMRLLYDDFAFLCAPEFLENSLDVVLEPARGAPRARQGARRPPAAADRSRGTCSA